MLRVSHACGTVVLLCLLTACGTAHRVQAPVATAAQVRQYAPPGPPGDPWGPHIRTASARFGVPETWIRAVMQQESGGRQFIDGALTTSPSGAMGLMQLMPQTYGELRQRHGLGPDPYDPRDNILAGAAYLREMYDRYGAPAFLAAYNAGPHRLDDFLSGASPLPAETVNYVAAVGPRIGAAGTLGRPGARYAAAPGPTAEALNRQVLAGILRPGAPDPRPQPTAAPDPAVTALNRQVLASAAEPRSAARAQPDADADADDLNRRMLARLGDPAPAPRPALAVLPAPATAPRSLEHAAPSGRWGVQVGAFSSPGQAGAAASAARLRVAGTLDGAASAVTTVIRPDGVILYRARLVGLSANAAYAACDALARQRIACNVVASDANGGS